MERDPVPENHREDYELATAAEQSADEDEAQTGDELSREERSEDPAESEAMHIVGDGGRSRTRSRESARSPR